MCRKQRHYPDWSIVVAEIQQGSVAANGLRFAYLEAGSGPLALCLHGFPDSAWTYRHLLPRLAAAGYHAVAPFMRGYAPTAIPGDDNFSTRVLADDVSGLHDALGGTRSAILIAHDWGCAAAYGGASAAPERWRRCAILNVPPLAIFAAVGSRYEQIKRSFYFWFFQMQIAEALVAADDLAFIDKLWGDWSPGFDARHELIEVKKCLRDPKNLRAALGYYRTLFNPLTYGSVESAVEQAAVWGRPLSQPTLYLHGRRDGCIALDADVLAQIPQHLGPGSEAEFVEGVGHFMLVERPQQVNDRILAFLGPAL